MQLVAHRKGQLQIVSERGGVENRLFVRERPLFRFTGVAWHPGPAGSPVLDEAPAWFVGRVENRIDGGDHVGFLLAPEAAENVLGDRTALLSLKDAHGITPGHPVD